MNLAPATTGTGSSGIIEDALSQDRRKRETAICQYTDSTGREW